MISHFFKAIILLAYKLNNYLVNYYFLLILTCFDFLFLPFSSYRYKTKRLKSEQSSSMALRKLPPGLLMNRDGKPFACDEKSLQLSSLATRGLLSSLPGGGPLNGMMNDYILSAAMMSAAATSLPNSLPGSCLPSASLFNNPALGSSSSIAAAVANLNNLNNFASNQSAIQQQQQSTNQQSSPSSTPATNQAANQSNNTSPPSNLNSFALNGLDQAVNYHLQHPSPYMQW